MIKTNVVLQIDDVQENLTRRKKKTIDNIKSMNIIRNRLEKNKEQIKIIRSKKWPILVNIN